MDLSAPSTTVAHLFKRVILTELGLNEKSDNDDDDDWMMIEDGLFLARPHIQYEICFYWFY